MRNGGDGLSIEPLGWGIVGCGWLARDYAAPAIRGSGNGRLVVAFDPDAAAAERVDAGRVAASLDDLLADDAVDAVYVATPNHLHATRAAAALAAGKHVLCEKPTTRTAAEMEPLVAATQGSGRLFATAYDQRFHGAHLALRELIAGGCLGTVTALRIHYACWTGPGWTPPGSDAHDNWRLDPARAGGGAMIDLAPHGLDLAMTLLGEELVAEDTSCLLQNRVHTASPVDDGAVIVARTTSGVLVNLTVAYNRPEVFPRRSLEVWGTDAMAEATNTMGQTPGGTLVLRCAGGGAEEPVDFADRDRSPFLNQIEAFADAALGRVAWPFPPERDLLVMRLLDRCAEGGSR